MAEPLRPLHPVPEADEDGISPVSSRRSHHESSSTNPFAPSLFRRSGYQRMNSDGVQDMADQDDSPSSPASPPPAATEVLGSGEGLGISMRPIHHRVSSASSIARRPVAGTMPNSPNTRGSSPRSYHGLLETPDTRSSSTLRQSPWDAPPPLKDRIATEDLSAGSQSLRDNAALIDGTPGSDRPGHFVGQDTPGTSDPADDFGEDHFDDEDFFSGKYSQPPSYCHSRKDIHTKRNSWLSITIFVLSVYSSVMSGIWLVVAIVQPRWGHGISSSRGLEPSTGTVLSALISKTIEMSFVTVFISCIGQVLTRRSLVRKTRGMTLAEMTMRNWVIQPGSLITHFETLQYAGLTILGALSLTATIAAIFYTTASDAMVAPKLKYGSWEHKELSGLVRSSYANPTYLKQTCPGLYDETVDPDRAFSCMDVLFSGQSYRNLYSFLGTWTNIHDNGTSIVDDLLHRPAGTTLLYDNTTMTGAWIETEHSNVTAHFEKTGRIINNVTVAMPHPGVYAAATSPMNGILQPDDLAGVGEYAVRAGVVSPSVNVLCVNMNVDELGPLIYTEWPDAETKPTDVGKQVTGPDDWYESVPVWSDDEYLNRTDVDDIFRWGPEYGRRPPVFQLFPADYNLIKNTTVNEFNFSSSDAIYLLGKAPAFENYTLCELRSYVSPNCSTQFNISGTAGASMEAHCEDPKDRDSYLRSFDPKTAWSLPSTDWRIDADFVDLADQWTLSMDLNGGADNGNASNARVLTQLSLQAPQLNPMLPSLAEALAVYASSTAVIGSMDSPFVHWWDYQKPGNILGEPGAVQPFNASIITQQYTSGHINAWQNIFYVVLVLVFVINLFCLVYFIIRSGLVTDYTEPQNLFALALMSPPSTQLQGSCGAGPEKRDLVVPWRVSWAPSVNHYFFQEAATAPLRGRYAKQGVSTARDYREVAGRSSYKRLSSSRSWL